MSEQFVCTELEHTVTMGSKKFYECRNWQQLQDQAMLPDLTKQQADELTVAVLSVMALAFAWSIVIKFISLELKK